MSVCARLGCVGVRLGWLVWCGVGVYRARGVWQAPSNALASSTVRARTLGYCGPNPNPNPNPNSKQRTLGYCGPVGA
eukprot:scaffold2105_cov62-Phaeocystis_antarctica.AAC.3